ncbi:hypothetical protein [Cytobacillus gottheilii]|uniref:hypothetical protein n=1 Tax=Cytobacillus gottheilii TaxID=859144 RepID=UPI0009BBDEDA|nr:hypothetical protein [Cytobacillus gottheilii]
MFSTALDNLDLGAKGLWFPIIVSIALFLTLCFIPKKKINIVEIYIIFCIVAFVTWLSDGIVLRVFDLIDLGAPDKPGLGDILSYTFIPPSLACIFLCYLDSRNKWIFVILFSAISFLIELGMEFSGYMDTNHWFKYVSLIFYIITFAFLLPLQLKIIRQR